jgi:hypothetical protein
VAQGDQTGEGEKITNFENLTPLDTGQSYSLFLPSLALMGQTTSCHPTQLKKILLLYHSSIHPKQFSHPADGSSVLLLAI